MLAIDMRQKVRNLKNNADEVMNHKTIASSYARWF